MIDTNQNKATENPAKKDDIMVIDDNPINLQLLVDILTDEYFTVRPVVNPKLALKAINSKSPDLILLDIKMPDVDGFTLCKILKKNPKHKNIPIIFVSALNDLDSIVNCFNVGGVDYVSKPFNSAEIISRINTHLTLRKINLELAYKNTLLIKEIKVRKQAELELNKINAEIEARIKERTAKLKIKEIELKDKNLSLQKLNSALKAMLDQRVVEKRSIEESMVNNINKYVEPYISKLSSQVNNDKAAMYLNMIKKNLDELIAPIDKTITLAYSKLSSSEIKTADLIRQGKTTKEIAEILLISPHTVSNFRYHIRKKLGLNNKKSNLYSYLNSLIQ